MPRAGSGSGARPLGEAPPIAPRPRAVRVDLALALAPCAKNSMQETRADARTPGGRQSKPDRSGGSTGLSCRQQERDKALVIHITCLKRHKLRLREFRPTSLS
jgi:hypothetical protein